LLPPQLLRRALKVCLALSTYRTSPDLPTNLLLPSENSWYFWSTWATYTEPLLTMHPSRPLLAFAWIFRNGELDIYILRWITMQMWRLSHPMKLVVTKWWLEAGGAKVWNLNNGATRKEYNEMAKWRSTRCPPPCLIPTRISKTSVDKISSYVSWSEGNYPQTRSCAKTRGGSQESINC
jgi:hypothetical protein